MADLIATLAATAGGVAEEADPDFENTVLLLHGDGAVTGGADGQQNNTFLDSSTNNFTITRAGNTTQGSFSPFPLTTAYNSNSGGSAYFDGSGDYLTTPTDAAFAVGSVFTIEFWLYPISYGANPVFIFLGESSGDLQFGLNSGNLGLAASGVAWRLTGSAGPTLNTWNHCVLVRSGTGTNQTSIFLNGTRIANGTVTDAWTTNKPAIIQSTLGSSYQTNGYMSSVRIVKGTAVYDPADSTITVPTAPLAAITNTSLLLSATNAGIYDNTGSNNLETSGNAQASTSQYVFGGSSLKFDGSGDYCVGPNQSWMNFSTGDLTIECWVRFNSVASTQMFVSSNYNASTGGGGWTFGYRADNTTLIFSVNANVQYGKTWSPSIDTWYFVTVCREGTNLRFFVDGTQIGTTSTSSDNISGATTLMVGSNLTTPQYLNGYLDDLRITSVARYTSNFTAPDKAFPNIGE